MKFPFGARRYEASRVVDDHQEVPPGRNHSPAEMEAFIAEWLAAKLGLEAADIRPDTRLADLGIDSLAAVELSGALEERSRRPVDPWMAWEHSDVASLAAAVTGAAGPDLADMDAPEPARTGPRPTGHDRRRGAWRWGSRSRSRA